MKFSAVLMATVILATTSAFAKDPKPGTQLDVDCQKMAQNAKGFAQLKQTGLVQTQQQLSAFVVEPTVQSYPIKSIINFVFTLQDKTPEEVYQSLYDRCTLMGYKELFTYFTEREEVAKLKAQLIVATDRINQLETDNRKLVAQINENLDKHTAHSHPNPLLNGPGFKK